MQDIKQNLADAIRKSRTELGLSQEKLAEILGFDSRTILNIENGRGNPKFEKLYPLVRHLNISADRIFYPESVTPQPNLQKLIIPELSEPPVRTLGATIPENESRLFR